MYSDKENVNILTSLLVAHGVCRAVVCPGSRNAPITHNLCECSDIQCVSATDERSAAFVAMGWSQAAFAPVAVCVTSGSALLNTLPAVAEAFHQHCQLVVISADRPEAMIGQLQGQTLPQPGALGGFVWKTVSLPEPHDTTERWHCNRLVNEALLAMYRHSGPVHINVPITEPLFCFNSQDLPKERVVSLAPKMCDMTALHDIAVDFHRSERPMVVIGQLPYREALRSADSVVSLRQKAVVWQEKLSDTTGGTCHFDEALSEIGDDGDYQPDFVVYIGDTLVSKRAKRFLQRGAARRTVIVNSEAALTDVTMHATDVVEGEASDMLAALAGVDARPTAFYHRWMEALGRWSRRRDSFLPQYSQMLAVRLLHSLAGGNDRERHLQPCVFHYANSSAVRIGQIYSSHYMFVNRGVNGIEGSLSAAVGLACGSAATVYCVIGDLSFFYDQNALWNGLRKDNLRILLLNNGCGGIFHQLPGLGDSAYRDRYVAAAHDTTAQGVCEAMHVAYARAVDAASLANGMAWLTDGVGQEPRLLEVMTDAEADAEEMRRYYARL